MKLAPDFPCLADEIAEPRPDMNIKVTAFTVSEKSINTTRNAPYKQPSHDSILELWRSFPNDPSHDSILELWWTFPNDLRSAFTEA